MTSGYSHEKTPNETVETGDTVFSVSGMRKYGREAYYVLEPVKEVPEYVEVRRRKLREQRSRKEKKKQEQLRQRRQEAQARKPGADLKAAQFYLGQGMKAKAKAKLETIIKDSPDSKEAAEAKKILEGMQTE